MEIGINARSMLHGWRASVGVVSGVSVIFHRGSTIYACINNSRHGKEWK